MSDHSTVLARLLSILVIEAKTAGSMEASSVAPSPEAINNTVADIIELFNTFAPQPHE